MRAFKITSPAHEPKIVFAESPQHAAEIITLWQHLNGIDATEFTVHSGWARQLTGLEREHLREVLRWNVNGIGMNYRADIGWAIGQPRDERDDL